MKIIKRGIAIFLCAISTFSYIPVQGQAMTAPVQTTPTYQELDVNSIKEELAIDTPEANQIVLNNIFVALHEKSESDVINELAKGLTIEELEKLYKVLIEAIDYDWTERFAEKVWQALSLKIKVESPVRYGNPRVNLIAVSPGERQFLMMLSDGSIWEVAEHLSGDSSLDLIIIRGLLGQYTEIEQISMDDNYSYRISALGFPEIRFNGYMLANKTSSLILENMELYWFGELYLED